MLLCSLIDVYADPNQFIAENMQWGMIGMVGRNLKRKKDEDDSKFTVLKRKKIYMKIKDQK